MSYLLQHKSGERVWSESLDGYGDDEWTVVKQGRGSKPRDHADFDGDSWKANPEKKAKAERAAKARSASREELVERLEELEARVAKLEGGSNA